MLEKARQLAEQQFRGRTDKAGMDYFSGHLSSVAGLVSGEKEKIVAYLHDILEDTDYPEEKLREEFGDEITDAVVLPRGAFGKRPETLGKIPEGAAIAENEWRKRFIRSGEIIAADDDSLMLYRV